MDSTEALSSKIPTNVYAEMTPNPATMKFVADRLLLPEEAPPVEYSSQQEAMGSSPLAQQLFQFPFVEGVFISGNFVSVTKSDNVEWDTIGMELREFIRDHLMHNQQVVLKRPEGQNGEESGGSKADGGEPKAGSAPRTEAEQKIVNLLEEYVKPAVEGDGGAIHFHSFEDGVVTVTLKGACSGCPSSTVTLKNGIETLLKQYMPEKVRSVEALEE